MKNPTNNLPQGCDATADSRPGDILVPVDFTEESALALRYAASIAQQLGAGLTLLHVLKPAMYVSDFPFPGPSGLDCLEAVEERIGKFAAKLVPRDLRVKTVVRQGFAIEGILATICESGAWLVVMATHARHGIWHFLTGGVAKNVRRHSPCPTLFVPGRAGNTAWTSAK